jgi:hypothetical protein
MRIVDFGFDKRSQDLGAGVNHQNPRCNHEPVDLFFNLQSTIRNPQLNCPRLAESAQRGYQNGLRLQLQFGELGALTVCDKPDAILGAESGDPEISGTN